MLSMLATTKSWRNIYFFAQHFEPGKITSQVLVLMIEYFQHLAVILRIELKN